jgi:hypothetical protein
MAVRSPLFDIYDPYGTIEAEQELLGERATISDLLPEEEKASLLRTLAQGTASGLSGLAWLLDTPGAMVRGTISGLGEGDPLRGLRALGQTADERVDGRELLRQYGLVGNEDNYGNFGGGLAAEMLLDPLSWGTLGLGGLLKGGIKSAAGRTAERAGLLSRAALKADDAQMGYRQWMRQTPRQIIGDDAAAMENFARAAQGKGWSPEDLLDMPMAGVSQIRIPGTEIEKTFSWGSVGDALASKLDDLGAKASTAPVIGDIIGRTTAAFDPSVMNEVDPTKQMRNRRAFYGAIDAERDEMEKLTRLQFNAAKQVRDNLPEGLRRFSDQRIQNAIRDSIEANLDPEVMKRLQDQEALAALEGVPAWKEWRDHLKQSMDDARGRSEALGLGRPMAQSAYGTGFFPAQSVFFDSPDLPNIHTRNVRTERPYTRGARVFNVEENMGRSRRAYTDLDLRSETFRRLQSGDFGRKLQDDLIAATDADAPGILDKAFNELGLDAPFSKMTAEGHTADALREKLTNPDAYGPWRTDIVGDELEGALRGLEGQQNSLKVQLADLLRKSDRQFSTKGMGLFDRSTVDDITRYATGRSKMEANARVLLDELVGAAEQTPLTGVAGGGQKNLLEEAARLGFDRDSLTKVLASRQELAERFGQNFDPEQLTISETVLPSLSKYAPNRMQEAESLLGKGWDSYTTLWKALTLANPAYHFRNQYSGAFSSLFSGQATLKDVIPDFWAANQASKGNYNPLYNRLKNAPGYFTVDQRSGERIPLPKEEAIEKFLSEAGRNQLGAGQMFEGGALPSKSLFVGGGDRQMPTFFDRNRKWRDLLTVRGVRGPGAILADAPAPSASLNPLLQLNDMVGRRVEDTNRLGTYLSQIRQGAAPDAAAEAVLKSQVDYGPRALTDFEKRYIKPFVPFYSYTRGIAPTVLENMLDRPGGLQSQSMRLVARAGQPSGDAFVPEHLRSQAAIPLPAELSSNPNLQRYLTNIDLPYQGLVDLINTGIGSTPTQRAYNAFQQTGLNLLGQMNPIPKTVLEMLLNRQLYSGRELSDVYSVLEKQGVPGGRTIEQLATALPAGTKALAIYRTAVDDRLTPADKALKLLVNNVAGAKLTDIDPEKSKAKAARDMLNSLLAGTPGVEAYENLSVPKDVLTGMPKDQQDNYLLYKILQSEAAKRARERRKAEMDPLSALGLQ